MTRDTTVHDTIRGFVEGLCFSHCGRRIPGDTWRLDSGLIDSVGIYELVTMLEKEFSITIPDEDVVPGNFESVARIVAFVDQKHAG
jgi:acyl carrier protein